MAAPPPITVPTKNSSFPLWSWLCENVSLHRAGPVGWRIQSVIWSFCEELVFGLWIGPMTATGHAERSLSASLASAN